MTDVRKETLSALYDAEASDFETRRLLQSFNDDDRQQWQDHQFLHELMASSVNATKSSEQASFANFDISAAVQDEIASDSVPTARWLKPVVGFATAASVAFIAVLSMNQMPSDFMPNSFIADGDVSASQLQLQSSQGVLPASGTVVISENANAQSSEASSLPNVNADELDDEQEKPSTFNSNN